MNKYIKCPIEVIESTLNGVYYIMCVLPNDTRICIGHMKDSDFGYKIRIGKYTNNSYDFNEALQLVFDYLNASEGWEL